MYILDQDQNHIFDTEKFDHFNTVKKPDATLIVLSASESRYFTLGRYENTEARTVLHDLFRALADNEDRYEMPTSPKANGMQERRVLDARVKRKGGS